MNLIMATTPKVKAATKALTMIPPGIIKAKAAPAAVAAWANSPSASFMAAAPFLPSAMALAPAISAEPRLVSALLACVTPAVKLLMPYLAFMSASFL